jgi:hypothetical protein
MMSPGELVVFLTYLRGLHKPVQALARITGKAAALLKREGKRFALATQCIGGGQGIATVLEAV